MVMEQVQKIYKLPLYELHKLAPNVAWNNPPPFSPNLSPVEVCHVIGEWYVAHSSEIQRRNAGQFFSPPIIAHYMANLAGILDNQVRILDPGAGIGILACAVCEAAVQQNVCTLSIVAYEADPVLALLCSSTLNYTRDLFYEHGIELSIELHQQDFVEAMAEQIAPISLWSNDTSLQHPFDLVILNPPYFKVNQKDVRAQLVKDIAYGRTNMYTMFMSLAASSLRPEGRFISITPRSFASDAYFKHFRQQFFNIVSVQI
ncbi:MAG: hypothetical protein NVSMB33_14030 [Ktedonobacteraceae bacterium]